MPTALHCRAQHQYDEAERTLATLGSLGLAEEDAVREAAVALVHAVLAIVASLSDRRTP